MNVTYAVQIAFNDKSGHVLNKKKGATVADDTVKQGVQQPTA